MGWYAAGAKPKLKGIITQTAQSKNKRYQSIKREPFPLGKVWGFTVFAADGPALMNQITTENHFERVGCRIFSNHVRIHSVLDIFYWMDFVVF